MFYTDVTSRRPLSNALSSLNVDMRATSNLRIALAKSKLFPFSLTELKIKTTGRWAVWVDLQRIRNAMIQEPTPIAFR